MGSARATVNSLDGSLAPMLVVRCRERLTAARLARLCHDLFCREGEFDCPVPAGGMTR
jgi:uncharacterized protein YecT (DUF1311 family)